MIHRLTSVQTQDDWERVLSAAAYVQQIVPDAILVGGSAAAIYAKHRFSADDDHVVADLKDRFARVLSDLETVSGWQTSRIQPPVLILGNFEGVDTGIRNLIRSEPLETTRVTTTAGDIIIPTIEEMFRIKSWLVVKRNAMRDYIDTVALADKIGDERAVEALRGLDTLYPQPGQSTLMQLAKQLAEPHPYDDAADLRIYKSLRSPYTNTSYLIQRSLDLAEGIAFDRCRAQEVERDRGFAR